jgi:hypothetical protein
MQFPPHEKDLLQRYKNGPVLIDANLLLLYVTGKTDRRIIPRFQRTQKYTVRDFDLLQRLLEQVFRIVLTTPNILTEVSNLATKLSESERPLFFDQMKQCIASLDERYCHSRTAASDRNYRTLGLTDAGILTVCHGLLVLTDDLPLYSVLLNRGMDAINFTHIRAVATLRKM